MAVFYRSKYIEGYLLEDEIVVFKYMLVNDYLPDKAYKIAALNIFEKIKEIKVEKFLIDKVNTDYVLTDELQEWIANNISPLCTFVTKVAFLMLSDIFAQLSTEQAITDISTKTVSKEVQYFHNFDDAISWLQEK